MVNNKIKNLADNQFSTLNKVLQCIIVGNRLGDGL